MLPQCNGGLFTQRLADPQGPKDGHQLACPPLTSGGLALEEVTCGDALSLQYSSLIKLASLSGKYLDQASLPVRLVSFFCLWMWRKKIELKSPKLHTQSPPALSGGGLREYAHPPQNGQRSGNLDTSSPCLTPPWSRGMGPGGRRPGHPSAKNQITPTSRLVNRQANHLLQNLVPLPQSCEGPSECNEATRLGLQWEGTLPQCNGGLFTRRLVDPQSPKDGRQLACPPLTGKV